MAPKEPGIQDGILYLFGDPTNNHSVIYVFRLICAVLALIMVILLCIFHFIRLFYLYKLSKMEENIGDNKVYIQNIFPSRNEKYKLGISFYYIWLYHILTILCIIFGLINTLIGFITEINEENIFKCGVTFVIIALSWSAVKFCIYGMSILRIFHTFNGSSLSYSNKTKTFLVVYLAFAMGFNVFNLMFGTKGYEMRGNGDHMWCQIGANFLYTIIGAALETVTNIVLAVLFMKPAIVLSKNTEHEPEMILNVIAKVGFLMSIVIITSLVLFGLMWFGLASLLYIDTATNIACVLLMHKTNAVYYDKCCKVCHNSIYKCCYNYVDRHRNKIKQKKLETTIQI